MSDAVTTGDRAPKACPAITRAVKPRIGYERQVVCAAMEERRLDLFLVGRQRHPALQAMQLVTMNAPFRRAPLRVHDASARSHPVHLARTDRDEGTETVPVRNLAVKQIRDGREPDMRMRPHVDAGPGAESRRPHLIQEDERTDHAPLRRRQRAADLEIPEIGGARHDHTLQRIA